MLTESTSLEGWQNITEDMMYSVMLPFNLRKQERYQRQVLHRLVIRNKRIQTRTEF